MLTSARRDIAFAFNSSKAAIYSRLVNVPSTLIRIWPSLSVVINTFECRCLSTMPPFVTHVPDKYESKEGIGLLCLVPTRGV